ncbi:substrate-binding domain-containing protein [Streptosporangium soli]
MWRVCRSLLIYVNKPEEIRRPGPKETCPSLAGRHRLLDRAPGITAIYAQSDLMAVGVLNALHELGRPIPGDRSVVGCEPSRR